MVKWPGSDGEEVEDRLDYGLGTGPLAIYLHGRGQAGYLAGVLAGGS